MGTIGPWDGAPSGGGEQERDADALVAALLDDLANALAWWRVEAGRRAGLDPSGFACVSLLGPRGWLSASVVAERVGLTRSAVSKLLRRLEGADHVELHGGGGPGAVVEVRLAAHAERDAELTRLRRELRRKVLYGAVAESDEATRAAAIGLLRRVADSVHLAASLSVDEADEARRVAGRLRRLAEREAAEAEREAG